MRIRTKQTLRKDILISRIEKLELDNIDLKTRVATLGSETTKMKADIATVKTGK